MPRFSVTDLIPWNNDLSVVDLQSSRSSRARLRPSKSPLFRKVIALSLSSRPDGLLCEVEGERLRDENDPAFIALAGPGLFDFGQRHRFDVNRKLELFRGGEHGA